MEAISPIVFGAGAFNTLYNKDPKLGSVDDVLRYALSHGVTTLDTSAYYGPSEEILGDSLVRLANEYPRESYFICTKAGRWETDQFDYTPESIRSSVARSLKRLHTTYLDLLYIHDVEFVSDQDALAAITEAQRLKQEGTVRFVGFSGYPVEYLCEIAELVRRETGESVDAVLSYCNMTIQNDTLRRYAQRLKDKGGVKMLLNASPLSMSLLRSGPTHDFHPASPELRKKATEVGTKLRDELGIELADVASQYSFANWNGPTVIGLRNVAEVEAAIANRTKGLNNPQPELWNQIISDFGDLHGQTWPSGLH